MKFSLAAKQLFVAFLVSSVWSLAFANYGIMPISTNTLLQWQADQVETPDYELPAGYAGGPRAVNLLTNLSYDAKIRDQGHTGSCWMWGCQGVMTLDYARQFPEEARAMTNGFSVQFLSSYLHTVNGALNEGGTPQLFKRFFDGFGYAIPWGNKNAAWTDYKGWVCTLPADIYTTPNVPISSMSLQNVNTFTASVSEAVTLLKSVLDSGHAMHFNLTLADGAEWDKFMNFWGKSEDNEDTIFTNFVSGKALNMATGGAHMMACVGYNDTDADPSKHYWIILNSWSTGDSSEDTRRPNGTWRLPMYMNYGAYTEDGMSGIRAPMFDWGILNTTFTNDVRKNIGGLSVSLMAGDQETSSISIDVPIATPGVIHNIYQVTLFLNERYYALSPEKGVWKMVGPREGVPPSGNLYEYTSNAGEEPSIRARVDISFKTLSCTLSHLSADDCRFIDPHRGLWFSATYRPNESEMASSFVSLKAVAYDELAELKQDSGNFTSPPQSSRLTFTSPSNGAVFAQGDTCVIEWTQEGLDGKLLELNLAAFTSSGITLGDMIPVEMGRYAWTVPYDIDAVTNGALSSRAGESLTFSGPAISLVPSTHPVLMVRAPAGGELWTTNTTRVISWQGLRLEGDLTIELLRNGEVVSGSSLTLAASAVRTPYTLPAGLDDGTYALRFGASGLVVTSASFAVTSVAQTVKPWTVLVYFDADNDLEKDQMTDFLSMAQVGSTPHMNVLAEMDRIPSAHVGFDNWYGAKRFFITRGMTPTLTNAIQDLGEVNVADPGTLIDFINWGVENYPAERTLLIFSDHGHGFDGALQDHTPNQSAHAQPMTLFEQVLGEAVTNMTIVGYDCCNMGILDSAYQLRNCGADVYIGSQYMETKGWAYAQFLQELETAEGNMTPRALASRICALSASMYDPRNPASLTAVDLKQLPAIAGSLAGFVDTLIATPEDRSTIRQQAAVVASNYYAGIIHHAATKQTELLTTGLNIHFPMEGPSDYVTEQLDFKSDAHWLAFLQAYTNTLKNTWIGEIREALGHASEFDLMRFIQAIHPPDDSAWVSLSLVERGEVDGLPTDENLLLRKGDVIQLIGRGLPAEQGGLSPRPATHFVRWWASDGATFSHALTEATNSVTITGHATILAYFNDTSSNYTVTVSAIGNGTVNGLDEAFQLSVPHGSNAPPLFAVASTGCVFSGWGGDITETANPLTLSSVISDMTLYGMFFEKPDNWSQHADITWWQGGVTQFTLVTPQQLAGLAQLVNSGTDAFRGKLVMLGTNLNLSGKEWTAIGTSAYPFAGSFNGQGRVLDGLTIQKTADDDYQGLFGCVSGAGSITIEHVHLTNTAIVAGNFVGALAGQVQSEEDSILVRHCSNAGSVWGFGSLVGGLVGELTVGEDGGGVTVSNCQNRATVSGHADTGGLLGRILVPGDAVVANAWNEGTVAGENAGVGGIVGSAASTSSSVALYHCENIASISGDADEIGGIIGKLSGGDVTINGCQNRGNLTVTGVDHQYAGGVVGAFTGLIPQFLNCRNTGHVLGQTLVGGVAGRTVVSMQNCSNEGRVEGTDRVGGVAGAVHGTGSAGMDNCLNVGLVVSTGRVGGVAGQIACDNQTSAKSLYFLSNSTTNTGLPFVGEMIPSTNLTTCATFAGLTGVLSTNGYGDKSILVDALNAWVNDNAGNFYWSTNQSGTPVYPYPDSQLTHVVVKFLANGGVFWGGYNETNRIYTLGQAYTAFPSNPIRTNYSFVGWWYMPEPGADPAKLQVDLTASPSITSADAFWSSVTTTQTPLPISVEVLAEYYPQVATMNEAQVSALANSVAANGRDKVWELLFLGLNPADPATQPNNVFVYMTTDPVQIHTVPETPLAGISNYRVVGKESLTDVVWTDLGSPGAEIPEPYRFFRVTGE